MKHARLLPAAEGLLICLSLESHRSSHLETSQVSGGGSRLIVITVHVEQFGPGGRGCTVICWLDPFLSVSQYAQWQDPPGSRMQPSLIHLDLLL